MAHNPSVKSLLFNFRLLYLIKYKAVREKETGDHSELEADYNQYQTLFAHWANPKFWINEIPWKPGTTSRLMLQLDQVDPTQTSAFLTAAKDLREHLENELLKDALQNISQTDISTWNMRMLNALRKVLQQEDGRVTFFKAIGNDLDNDSSFQEMRIQQLDLVLNYRELLKTNSIEATESKVSNVERRGDSIENERVLAEFFKRYQKLNNYIAKQVNSVSLMPSFAEAPTAENQKSLQALSLALITMDQKISTLATAGEDFTQAPSFASLSADQWTLQNDFSSALQSNTLEVANTCTEEITQITTGLEQVNDLAGIQQTFESLNDLMRTQISATT